MRWLLVLAMACSGARGGAASGDSASFSVTYPDAPQSGVRTKLGKHFYAKPVAQCTYDNGRDARWAITGARVTSGDLPPGVTIEDGAITGTPTKAGDYNAKIVVTGITCAGKSEPDQEVSVWITVK